MSKRRADRFKAEAIRVPLCVSCKHYLGEQKCNAFPDGIPEAILKRKFDHRMEYPGDNGIQYERM